MLLQSRFFRQREEPSLLVRVMRLGVDQVKNSYMQQHHINNLQQKTSTEQQPKQTAPNQTPSSRHPNSKQSQQKQHTEEQPNNSNNANETLDGVKTNNHADPKNEAAG